MGTHFVLLILHTFVCSDRGQTFHRDLEQVYKQMQLNFPFFFNSLYILWGVRSSLIKFNLCRAVRLKVSHASLTSSMTSAVSASQYIRTPALPLLNCHSNTPPSFFFFFFFFHLCNLHSVCLWRALCPVSPRAAELLYRASSISISCYRTRGLRI